MHYKTSVVKLISADFEKKPCYLKELLRPGVVLVSVYYYHVSLEHCGLIQLQAKEVK